MIQVSAGAMQDAAQVERRTRGRFKPGMSGNPSGRTVGKRYLALFADLARDLGGEAALSAIDRALLSQAVGLMVRAERVKDTDSAVRLANASARLLASLRNTRRTSPKSGVTPLAAYLATRNAEQLADEDESEPAAERRRPSKRSVTALLTALKRHRRRTPRRAHETRNPAFARYDRRRAIRTDLRGAIVLDLEDGREADRRSAADRAP